mgnify:CR=1 FL=1
MGYFYLRRPYRLLMGSLWLIFAGLILKMSLAFSPAVTYGVPHLVFLLLLFIAFFTLNLWDTLNLTKVQKPEPTGIFSRPWSLIAAPVLYLTLLLLNSIMDPLEDKFLRANVTQSTAMSPGLLVDEYFFWAPLFDSQSLTRGDIIVYTYNRPEPVIAVSRIIGLPGDRIQIIHSVVDNQPVTGLSINSNPLAYRLISSAPKIKEMDLRFSEGSVLSVEETLPSGRVINIFMMPEQRMLIPSRTDTILNQEEYFVVSDNRDDALDSRLPIVGPITRQQILGTPMYVYLSLNRGRNSCKLDFAGEFHPRPCDKGELPSLSISSVRWDRIGRKL